MNIINFNYILFFHIFHNIWSFPNIFQEPNTPVTFLLVHQTQLKCNYHEHITSIEQI